MLRGQSHAGSQDGGQLDIGMLYPRRPDESQRLLLRKACICVSEGSLYPHQLVLVQD